jgi:hypothetical protein
MNEGGRSRQFELWPSHPGHRGNPRADAGENGGEVATRVDLVMTFVLAAGLAFIPFAVRDALRAAR